MPIPQKKPEILYRISSEDSVVLVDLELEDYFWELNGLSADLWKDIDGVRSWDEIKKNHQEYFQEEDGDFHEMSDSLLSELVAAGLIILKD